MLYKKTEDYILYQGKMEEELKNFDSNSIDSIVTDPPYELNFMNKGWDNSGIAFQKSTWEHCFRVLKPGGYLLAFGGSRTFHRIAVAIEDAGFEIRDTIMWLYGSGFPKSLNLSKSIESKLVNGNASNTKWKTLDGTKVESGNWGINKNAFEYGFRPDDYAEDKHLRVDKVNYQTEEGKKWDGWGTCLKPAYEPIIVARKPCEGSATDNVLKYGVGGINIDECRIPISSSDIDMINAKSSKNPTNNYNQNEAKKYGDYALNIATKANEQGRFPTNVILTYDGTDYEEVCGGFPESKGASSQNNYSNGHIYRGQSLQESNTSLSGYREWYNDSGSASRYFYCAKASKKDRDEGLDSFEGRIESDRNPECYSANVPFNRSANVKKNIHPTVKPTELMQYLVRLVTPKGATILDPFMGSGSTGKAVMLENRERNANYTFVGIELTEDYLPICEARIEFGKGYSNVPNTSDVKSKDTEEPKQLKKTLF